LDLEEESEESKTAEAEAESMPAQLVFIEETGDRSGLWGKRVRRNIRQQARLSALEDQVNRHPFVTVYQQHNSNSASSANRPVKDARKHSKAQKSQAGFEKSRTLLPLGTDGAAKGPTDITSRLLWPLPLMGYEKARSTFDADILELSALTSIHLGKGASFTFGQRGKKLWGSFDNSKGTSHLGFIPFYYDRSKLVRTVTDCVLARMKLSAVQQSNTDSQVLELYGVALSELQKAINHPNRRMEKDVLLAISILQLYEVRYSKNVRGNFHLITSQLIDEAPSQRWSSHTRALIRLIGLHKPEQFRSELEIRLIGSQAVVFVRRLETRLFHPNANT
jgi:hypothetical protein